MDELRGVASLLERMHDAPFVVGAERFDGHAQLDRSAAVRGNELVVIEADHVAILLGNDLRHVHQLSRAIRQEYRHGEDAIALDKAVLHHGCHGDHVHVSARKNGDDLLVEHAQVLE